MKPLGWRKQLQTRKHHDREREEVRQEAATAGIRARFPAGSDWLLDARLPVRVLATTAFADGPAVLVAVQGMRSRQWVAPGRLVAFGAAVARPAWREEAE